jgi:hypothetical protein
MLPAVPASARARSCPRTHGHTRISFFIMSNSTHPVWWARRAPLMRNPNRPSGAFAHPTFLRFLYSLHFSFLLPSLLSLAPSRGACGAPVAHGCLRRTQIGMPYTLTQDARERACDRHADVPSIGRPEQKSPSCVRCAPQFPRGRDRYAQTEPRSPIRVETSCVPSDWHARLAALHVGFLARARACRCPACAEATAGKPARVQRRLKPPVWSLSSRLLGAARHTLQDRAPFAARVIVTRRSGSREPPRRGR